MIKILIPLLTISLLFGDYRDTKPSKITHEDLELIKKFDDLAYNLAEDSTKTISIPKVVKFIFKHKRQIIDYNLLTIELQADTGRKTRSYGVTDEPNQYNYYKAGVRLYYPLYDKKLEREIKNKQLEYQSKIIDAVEKYALYKARYKNLKHRLQYYRLLQRRAKTREKSGMIYKDDRLKIVRDILKLNEDMIEAKIERDSLRELILTLVKREKVKALKSML